MKKILMTTAIVMALSAGTAQANPHEGKEFDGIPRHMEETLAKLPADKAKLVKDSMEKTREAHKAQFEQIKALKKQERELLTADTFDKNAYLAKVRESDVLRSKVSESRAASFADAVVQLTKEERKILSDGMAERFKGKGKKDHHKKEHDAPEHHE